MKKIVLVLLVITGFFCFNNILAQDEIEFTGSPTKDKKILLVPFDPRIYFNDATDIISKRDGSSYGEIMEYFRLEFNKQLYNAMMDSCLLTNLLLTVNARESETDLQQLYSIISYELGVAMKNKPEDPDDEAQKGYWERRREKKEEEYKKILLEQEKTQILDGEIVANRASFEDKYLNIVFHHPEVLSEIAKRREIEYFLYINHFEIKGDYRDPYMSGNPDAKRTIQVHFSLFDNTGTLVHGGFGENMIPFALDDKKEIANIYFPEVIRQIIRNIDF